MERCERRQFRAGSTTADTTHQPLCLCSTPKAELCMTDTDRQHDPGSKCNIILLPATTSSCRRKEKKISSRINQISTASFHVKRSDALKMKSHKSWDELGESERSLFLLLEKQPSGHGFLVQMGLHTFLFSLSRADRLAHQKNWLPYGFLVYLFTHFSGTHAEHAFHYWFCSTRKQLCALMKITSYW